MVDVLVQQSLRYDLEEIFKEDIEKWFITTEIVKNRIVADLRLHFARNDYKLEKKILDSV